MAQYDRSVFTIEHNDRTATVRWDINVENGREYLYLESRGVNRSSRFNKDEEDCEVETLLHRRCDDIDLRFSERGL